MKCIITLKFGQQTLSQNTVEAESPEEALAKLQGVFPIEAEIESRYTSAGYPVAAMQSFVPLTWKEIPFEPSGNEL